MTATSSPELEPPLHVELTKPPSSRAHLADNMQMARTLLGWSQDELGRKCGLKRTYIGAIERQEINPGIDNLDRIAAGMGIASFMLILNPEQAQALMYKHFQKA